MFSSIRRTTTSLCRGHQVRTFKVSVLGASGGIGQPLALLLKLDPRVSELALFDVVRTPGVAADISHCDTKAKVTGHVGTPEHELLAHRILRKLNL
jgi:malate/lactate dehydrogenase